MKAFTSRNYLRWISILFVALFLAATAYQPAYSGAQSATFSGRVISVRLGPVVPFANRKATLVIEDKKGRQYTVHAGIKTSYYPRRTPQYGDWVTVHCIKDKGLWAATTITYR